MLLRAAQAMDEGRGNVVPLPVREAQEQVNAGVRDGTPKPPRKPAAVSGNDVVLALRLSSDGELLERQGQTAAGDEDAFCDAVAYAAQLTDLVGALLGQGLSRTSS